MLLTKLDAPITLFNCAQHDVDITHLQKTLRDAYADYEWDTYLIQQNKISLIREQLPQEANVVVPVRVWHDLYHGIIQDADVPLFFPALPADFIKKLTAIAPTRKRCISQYNIEWKGQWNIERVSSQPFAQSNALLASANALDYRVGSRTFKELPDALFDESLLKLIKAVANKTKEAKPNLKKMKVVVHHTVVYCDALQLSTNSPEGVHQDGMDYIVSALVIERQNISGGKSIIYGSDKTTKLFQCELQSGQGIFQADANTELWHEVTPITARDENATAFRSTVGFDVSVVCD